MSSTESNFKNLFNKTAFKTNSSTSSTPAVGGSGSTWSSRFSSSTSTLFGNISNTAQGYMPVNSPFNNSQPIQEPSWYSLTLWQKWVGFGMFILAGVLFFFISFMTLPLIVLKPSKFALSFSFGSLFFFTSIAFLRGPLNHFKSVFNFKQLPFSLTYFGSLILTLVSAITIKSFLLTIISLIIQVFSLIWYFMSFMPGGSRLMARTATSFLPI